MKNFAPIFISLLVLFTACERSIPVDITEQTGITIEYKLMTPAYYRNSEDGSSIQVRFYESQRIFDLPLRTENFEVIKAAVDAAIESKSPVRVFIGTELTPYVGLQKIEPASKEEIAAHSIKLEDQSTDVSSKKILPSMTALNEVFAYCASQGCTTGTATIDYCIPFQYVVDGCYARAHKMRQIMFSEYNLGCEKVFSYEGNHGSLAVDAGDCCVFWWYHVAPLVTVKVPGGGTAKYVVDPSMFDGPVTIDTWTTAQENASCPGMADFGHYEIEPGYIYTPGGGTDNTYSSTNWTLQFYADLVTCD